MTDTATKRQVLPAITAFASVALALAAAQVQAQAWPSRPIRMIVAQAPGGSGDLMARVTASNLSERLGVPVVVENKPGGAFIIGTEAVARAAPDGYTLLHTSMQGLGIFPTAEKLPYDPDRDLQPIAMVAFVDSLIAISSKLGAKNLKEFIAIAKARPGQLTYGSSGPGSVSHFNLELFRLRTGVDALHVPFKGGMAALAETVAGRIDVALTGTLGVSQHIASGAIVPLASLGKKRSRILPDIPTMVELGYPDALGGTWYGVIAPAGMPQPVVRRLAREIGDAAASPKFAEQTAKVGQEIRIELLDEFARTIAAERRLWHAVAKEANIKLE